MFRSHAPLLLPALLLGASAAAQFGEGQPVLPWPLADVQAIDLDADGDLDLIGISDGDQFKPVYNMDGAGTFQYVSAFPPCANMITAWDVCDVDGDGLQDVVYLSADDEALHLFRNIDGMDFLPSVVIATAGPSAVAIRCNDITGDGLPEILLTTENAGQASLTWLPNLGGVFAAAITVPDLFAGPASPSLLAGDLDLDGSTDVVLFTPNAALALRNTAGDGSAWEQHFILPWSAFPFTRPALADADGDGAPDLLNAGPEAVYVALNPIAGGEWGPFSQQVVESGPEAGTGAFGRTACGTGLATVHVPTDTDLPVRWRQWMAPLAGFSQAQPLPTLPRAVQVLLADLNGDGLDDLLRVGSTGILWHAWTAAPPSTTLELPALDTLCRFGSPVPLPVSLPLAGAWSGPAVFGDLLHRGNLPSAGTYVLACTAFEPEGCPVTATTAVQMIEAPAILPTLPTVLCSGDAPVQLTSVPANTEWTGPEPGGLLDPASFTGGIVACAYTDPTGETCVNLVGPLVVWTTLPAAIAPLPSLCVNSGPQLVEAQAAPFNGVSWVGPVQSWSSAGAVFEPSQGAGTYTVVMLVSPGGPGQCGNSDTLLITVSDDFPVVLVPDLPASCAFGPALMLPDATPTGGQWMGPGVNASQGVIDPLQAGAGSHLLSYTYQAPEGCATTATSTLVLHTEALLQWNAPDLQFCPGDPVVNFSATPHGGFWSPPLAANGIFHPSLTPPGSYPVAYTWTGANGCMLPHAPAVIEVWANTPVAIDPVPTLCVEDPPYTITGSHEGVWSGMVSGAGGSVVFDPAQFGQGAWPVVLTAEEPGFCTGSAVVVVVVRVCAGIAEQDPLGAALLAPNPFSQEAWLSIDAHGPMGLTLLDAAGRTVLTWQETVAGPSRLPLPMTGLPQGSYILRLEHGGRIHHLRAVKTQ